MSGGRRSVYSNFITKLLVTGDLNLVIDEGIKHAYFTGTDRRAFDFIMHHFKNYGNVPSVYAFRRKFKTYPLTVFEGEYDSEESLAYWIDELRSLKVNNVLAKAVEDITIKLQDDEIEAAKKYAVSLSSKLVNDYTKPSNANLKDIDKRLLEYEAIEASGGVIGYDLGDDMLNELLKGAVNGTLTTIMAFTGIGKTFMLTLLAVYLCKELGLNVLFVTIETTKKLIFRRIDAIWNEIDYSRFTKYQLTKQEKIKMSKYAKDVKKHKGSIVVEELVDDGVSAIRAKIEQFSPDVVFVDGAYLLADDNDADESYRSILNIWNDLHKLCIQVDKPIFATTQSKDEKGATIKSLNFAKALATATDNLISLEQDETMKADLELYVKPLKLREGELIKGYLKRWDLHSMNFDVIYTDNNKDDSFGSVLKSKEAVFNE